MKKTILFILLCGLTSLSFQKCSSQEKLVDKSLQDQILHMNNGSEPATLDPDLATGDVETTIIDALFEGLVAYHEKTLAPIPGVAKSWTISDDGLTYTFELRKNAKWSNGDPVTAHDFAYAWQRLLSPELASEYSFILFDVKNAKRFFTGEVKDFAKVGVKILDDYHLQVTLETPTPYFLKILTLKSLKPVHKATVEKYGTMTQRDNTWTHAGKMVSNGPFRLKHWRVNEKIIVEKNPMYWDKDKVKLNEVHFYPIEDDSIAEKSFRAGKLHIIKILPVAKNKVYQEKYRDVYRSEPYLGSYYYLFNTKRKPLDDVRVRQALAYAVDRNLLAKYVAKGSEIANHNLVPTNAGGFTAKTGVTFDLEKAKKLLAEAGYPDGKGFPEISILYNTTELHREIAEAIQQMWKKNLNITIKLYNQEWKVYLNSIRQMDYDIARRGWIADYDDASSFFDMYLTNGDMNMTGFANTRYDELSRLAASTLDQEKRFEYFQEASQILIDEMPLMPIFQRIRNYALHTDVKGWYPTSLNLHPLKEVYLERK